MEEVGKDRAQKNEAILQKVKDRYHYGTIDLLAEAVRYGHEIGLEIHAWFRPTTLTTTPRKRNCRK